MAGLGFVLGGALEGIGKGLATMGLERLEEERQRALEKLRAENNVVLETERKANKREEMELESNYADRNNSRQVARTTSAKLLTDNNDSTNNRAEAEAASKSEEARLTRLENLRTNNEIRKAAFNAGIDASQVHDLVTDGETGAVSVIYKNGSSRSLPTVIARPKPTATGGRGGDDLGDLEKEFGLGGNTPPAAKSAPRAQASASPPAARARQPQRVRAGDQTYTMSDVRATARAAGKSENDVLAAFRQRGYKLTSGD